MRELGELAERSRDFARLGVRIVAISREPVEDLRDLQDDLGDAVIIVSDPEAVVVGAFGMIDRGGFPPGIAKARAGVIHVDAKGIVRHVWLAQNYRRRPDADAMLAALKR